MNRSRWYVALWTALKRMRGSSRAERVAPAAVPSAGQAVNSGAEPPRETYGRIEPVLTHACPGEDRGMRLCRCAGCGVVRQCTPDFDFYETHARSPLLCFDCLCDLVGDAQNSGIQA